jgi:hypothetical protein
MNFKFPSFPFPFATSTIRYRSRNITDLLLSSQFPPITLGTMAYQSQLQAILARLVAEGSSHEQWDTQTALSKLGEYRTNRPAITMIPEYQQYFAGHRLWIMLRKFVMSRYLAYKGRLESQGVLNPFQGENFNQLPGATPSNTSAAFWGCSGSAEPNGYIVSKTALVYTIQLLRYLSTWEASILLKPCGKEP